MNTFHYYKLDYAEVLVFENYLINQVSEGVLVKTSDVDRLRDIIIKHFSDNPWVYISNRVFSYSVDPMSYKKASKIKNLRGIVIVAPDEMKMEMAQFEQNFSDIPVTILETLTQAIVWADQLCS